MKLNIIIDVFVYMCSAVHSSPTLVASILDRKIDQAQMEYISYAFTHNNRRQCAPDRPGCPKCTSHKATPACPVCVVYRHQCDSDKECKRGQMCCLNPKCGRSCREPERITKPGECPVNTRPDQMCAAFVRPGYFNCVHDGRCPGNQKCCRQGCYLGCVESDEACDWRFIFNQPKLRDIIKKGCTIPSLSINSRYYKHKLG